MTVDDMKGLDEEQHMRLDAAGHNASGCSGDGVGGNKADKGDYNREHAEWLIPSPANLIGISYFSCHQRVHHHVAGLDGGAIVVRECQHIGGQRRSFHVHAQAAGQC